MCPRSSWSYTVGIVWKEFDEVLATKKESARSLDGFPNSAYTSAGGIVLGGLPLLSAASRTVLIPKTSTRADLCDPQTPFCL